MADYTSEFFFAWQCASQYIVGNRYRACSARITVSWVTIF